MVKIEAQDLRVWTSVEPDGTTEVYLCATDLLSWLRSTEHAEVNQPILQAIADLLDFAALASLVDAESED